MISEKRFNNKCFLQSWKLKKYFEVSILIKYCTTVILIVFYSNGHLLWNDWNTLTYVHFTRQKISASVKSLKPSGHWYLSQASKIFPRYLNG